MNWSSSSVPGEPVSGSAFHFCCLAGGKPNSWEEREGSTTVPDSEEVTLVAGFVVPSGVCICRR